VLERIDCTYSKVIKPLADMHRLDGGATVAVTRNALDGPYYQRYVITDHDTGRPLGWISAATLVTADGSSPLAELARPMPTLPATTSLAVALQRMHQQGADLALVADPDGQPTSVLFRNDCLRVLAKLL
jgi:CBS domain containing-hemolysin-like protein